MKSFTKLDIFNEIFQNFSDIANKLINETEKICLNEPDFIKLKTEQEKADFVMNHILSSPEIINEDLQFIVDLNNFLKNSDILERFYDFKTENNMITGNVIFKKEIAYNSLDEKQLHTLLDSVMEKNRNIGKLTLEVQNQMSILIKFLTKFPPEKKDLFNTLEIKLKNTIKQLGNSHEELKKIFSDNNVKIRILEEKAIEFNKQKDKIVFEKKAEAIKKLSEKAINKQEEIIKQLQNISISAPSKLIEISSLVDDFSTLYLILPSINDISDASGNPNNNLNLQKENLYANSREFINILKEKFERILTSIPKQDKKNYLMNTFLNPIKNDLSESNYQILISIFETIFKK